jgi:hypothetical protein
MKEYFFWFVVAVAVFSGTWTLIGFISSLPELRRLLSSTPDDEAEEEPQQEQNECGYGGNLGRAGPRPDHSADYQATNDARGRPE